ncbi:MAG: Gfo/Idh/MocA family protein [Bryobacteraceae bacterium]
MERRTFLLASTSAAAQTAPSDQLALGLIGAGGRGRYVMQVFRKDPAVRAAAVCDVYEPNLEAGLSAAGNQAKAYRNYKALLDDRSIQIVLIATPEHWHHRMVLDAMAAGKDVYVEKPLCQTPEQGADLVRASRQSKSIVQVGMQRRSYDLYLKGRDIVAAGTLGTVRMVRSWWLNNYLQTTPGKLKGPLDWEQWQGPARRRDLDPDRFLNWRNYSDYAGGIVADQGAHAFDGIHLLMGAGFPSAVTASAGRPHRAGFDTPESVVVAAEYPEDFVGVFTLNYAAMKYKGRNDQLNHLDGDKARMDIGREELRVYLQGAEESAAITQTSARGFGYATDLHVQNFLASVRTRAQPTAPLEVGFQSCLPVLLGNLALKQGRRFRWNAQLMKVEM